MEKYEVIGLLGEGSFGRVYKAKLVANSTFVALKVISKRGRSVKELKGLRRECEIQRYLHHPNIIQMLDSFETENEIVVITEFAHKELNYILGKEGYLPEERVRAIVWDLVSALYYLHSHRVLHRDLKPQNILLDSNNVAKLCDFGFARNMSTGTHVLTSIKGTPLYMAPELIEEQPYDHNADLWSLGCIVYELLVGAPPFCTSSILHLIRLIRHEQIQWPTFISDNCVSFLKGLLQKNPSKRLAWPEILNHPFVKGHVIITENTPSMPLTRPMSANTLQVKEQQRNQHINLKTGAKMKTHDTNHTQTDSLKNNTSKGSKNSTSSLDKSKKSTETDLPQAISKLSINQSESCELDNKTPEVKLRTPLNFYEDNQPIENDEWIAFLQKTIEEIMNCEIGCLLQANSTNILVNPLRNVNASSKVVGFVASLFCLPFIVHGVNKETLIQIQKVYLEVKLVPNLVYASKLITSKRAVSSASSTPTPTNSQTIYSLKSLEELSEDDLQTLEYIYLLICRLVYTDVDFLNQFCDAVVILNVHRQIQILLTLAKRKVKIVSDILSILTHILRKTPENTEVIDKVITKTSNDGNRKTSGMDLVGILRNQDTLLRERCCYMLLFLGKTSSGILRCVWSETICETLEALMYDSIENVRNAAELAVDELKGLEFYKNRPTSETNNST